LPDITAPYNFVPLSGWVFQPDWAHQVSHDVPFKEGLSGCLDIEITAKTPILVGGKQIKATRESPGEVRFFKLPNDQCAIPGTSLKGMIRNVLEIASFGKMQFVDDRRLSIRDISGREVIGDNYIDKIVDQKAGFLRLRDHKTVELIPCKAAYVKHEELIAFLNKKPQEILAVQLRHLKTQNKKEREKRERALKNAQGKYVFQRGMSVYEKYAIWQELASQQSSEDLPTLSFDCVEPGEQLGTIKGLKKGEKGTLFFTTQISDKGQNKSGKYRDFVFYDRQNDSPLEVSLRIFKDFLYIHGDEDKKSAGSWQNFWKNRFFNSQSHEIPVFYHLDDDGQVRSIGLAYMYRLAYHYSIGETIDYTNENHRNPIGCDLADLLFGKIQPDEDHSQENLKSRVSFGTATVIGTPQHAEAHFSEATILNGPKPTYFPNYIRQQVIEYKDKLANKQYRTYMQDDSEIRGWKRYPVRRWEAMHLQVLEGKQEQNKLVQVKLFPLKKGTTFKSTIRFHNLLPKELGALIWALTWGGDEELCHSLGMGKPFGFGQVSIEIVGSDIRSNQAPEQKIAFDQAKYIELFEKLMADKYTKAQAQNSLNINWEKSDQIKQLKAMANPELLSEETARSTLKHMSLERGEFVDAKQGGKVLPEYGGFRRYYDARLFPRTPRKKKPHQQM
jgi:CRISPR-associated protein (TIGR03986 family)